ncbi:PREDICTED: uncharacterized protein LOC107073647, partial [Polistes dominula]|uniref:Uncharacterized protein LOC107073647 n=1 Tax=Polistes dominula TaxID=743375 RepID=A0ABM1JBI9_POLDO
MIAGVRKDLEIVKAEAGKEGMIQLEIRMAEEEIWHIIIVYNREGEKEKLREVEECIERNEGKRLLIMGDFNARISDKGGTCWMGEEEKRKSKDRVINAQGYELLKMVAEYSLGILNRSKKNDEKGEWTFVSKIGSS